MVHFVKKNIDPVTKLYFSTNYVLPKTKKPVNVEFTDFVSSPCWT